LVPKLKVKVKVKVKVIKVVKAVKAVKVKRVLYINKYSKIIIVSKQGTRIIKEGLHNPKLYRQLAP
jgi:hypothetical protein